jgi:hypothetical protein
MQNPQDSDMVINKAEMDRRLNSAKNLANTVARPSITISKLPKRVYTNKRDPLTRTVTGILSKSGEPSKNIQAAFGMTPSQVQCSRDLPGVSKGLEKINDMAIDKMLSAMSCMKEEMFERANLKDLSAVAANMSRVIEKTAPKTEIAANLSLHIYVPEQKDEKHFKTIDI